jgi:hypothetical protein
MSQQVRVVETPSGMRGLRLMWATFLIQGMYYIVTGLWSIVGIRSFMDVTGPKTDIWLVHTVGAILVVAGVVLLRSARRRNFSGEIVLLSIGCAFALTMIDCVYVFSGVIPSIYLADGAVECVFVFLVIIARAMAVAGRRLSYGVQRRYFRTRAVPYR